MAEPKPTQKSEHPSSRRDRDRASDRPERKNYTAGASGEQNVSLDGQMGPDEIDDPDELARNQEAKMHSEREVAGDQDIDTAGMIPGNKATDTP
jgi:hypothetical protein